MTSIALALWAFLLDVGSRIGLLEAYEVASVVLLLALGAVLVSLARRRPALRLGLEDAREVAATPSPAVAGAVAVRPPTLHWRPHLRRRQLHGATHA